MSKIKALIADVDGTILDTLEVVRRGQYEAAMKHFHEIGMLEADIPSYEKYHEAFLKVVGGHVRETLESTSALLYKDRPDIRSLLDFDRMTELLKPIQDEMAQELVQPYEGLEDLLKYVSEQDMVFGIFTSGKPHHIVRNFGVALPELNLQDIYSDQQKDDFEKLKIFTERFKKTFGLKKLAIITGEDVSAHKPDPESVYAVLERLDVQPEHAAALGDHVVDMKAAKAAGVLTRIGITHGFDDEAVLREAGATQIVNSLDEVKKWLQN